MIAALLALACAPDAGTGAPASDAAARFLPAPGARFELVRPEDPAADAVHLEVSEDALTWSLRLGPRPADAVDLATWAADLDAEGFWLDTWRVLPARLVVGEDHGDLRVMDLDPLEVYYGEFPRVARVSTLGGPLEGEQAFAEDVGPVRLTLDGQTWELAAWW